MKKKWIFLAFFQASSALAEQELLTKNYENTVVITGPRRNQELFNSPASEACKEGYGKTTQF